MGLRYRNEFQHSTDGKKLVTVTKLVMVSKNEQHQPLHYST